MNHFIYTTQEKDHGLRYETLETLHVGAIGHLTVLSSNNNSEVKYSGNDATSNTCALLEAILFINSARRNSKTLKLNNTKTLKIDSTVQSDEVTTIKGTINMQRFILCDSKESKAC